jgi:hypothetical protein
MIIIVEQSTKIVNEPSVRHNLALKISFRKIFGVVFAVFLWLSNAQFSSYEKPLGIFPLSFFWFITAEWNGHEMTK